MIRRVSVEPSRRCSKACAFCYNGSVPEGDGEWSAAELVAFGRELADHGVQVLSLGGGEPFEWEGTFDVLSGLEGALYRSLTTNGLPLLDQTMFERLVAARPDKVHVSIHDPRGRGEVRRVIEQVTRLADAGIASGVNLVVARSKLDAVAETARALHAAGVDNERIVYLPMRGFDTPTPEEVHRVAGGPFQSMTCLRGCGKSPRFVSIAADRTVAWCSYTRTRRRLEALEWSALMRALDGLGLAFCGDEQLVRLGVQGSRAHDAGG